MSNQHRCLKFQMGLWLLLPYAILAISAPFLHTCGGGHPEMYEPAQVARTAPVSLDAPQHETFTSQLPTQDNNRGTCVACTWTRSSLSIQQSISPYAPAEAIAPFAICKFVPHYQEPTLLIQARGPPLG